ncbi:putative fad binding domain protein [Fonsecaea pedrosoi]|nr:putative fad binding domain protein [Fonsecaea pedrosoi]
MFPIKLLAKGVTGAYGLAREAMADHDVKKTTTGQTHLQVPASTEAETDLSDTSSVESSDGEAAAQELDEVQQSIAPKPKDIQLDNAHDVDEVLEAFMKRHPPPNYSPGAGILEMPVILPQRRPKSKERGFIRAYAPMLQTCGVEQGEFLDFLDAFGKAIKLHPVFHAFNLACAGAVIASDIMVGPMFPVHVGAMVIHTGVELSRRQYVKYESNKYLDNMNESFFKPRGLYALVMAYQPDSDDVMQNVDMNTHVVTSIAKRDSGRGSRFANAAGSSREVEIPESAPIIFPELDDLPAGEKENAFKRSSKRLVDYFDRRAQAKFEQANPGSKLNLYQERQFASRFSDPNHPANSGSLIALLSGGKIDTTETDRATAERRARKRQFKDSRRVARGREPRYDITGVNKRAPQGGIKGLMKSDVLYLMIVNYPSEAELKAAAQAMTNLRL